MFVRAVLSSRTIFQSFIDQSPAPKTAAMVPDLVRRHPNAKIASRGTNRQRKKLRKAVKERYISKGEAPDQSVFEILGQKAFKEDALLRLIYKASPEVQRVLTPADIEESAQEELQYTISQGLNVVPIVDVTTHMTRKQLWLFSLTLALKHDERSTYWANVLEHACRGHAGLLVREVFKDSALLQT